MAASCPGFTQLAWAGSETRNSDPNAKIRAAAALPTLRLILSLLVGVAGMYSCTIILDYMRKGA
jgi:hypothetical protein